MKGNMKCNRIIAASEDRVTITGWHTGYGRYSVGLRVFRKVDWVTRERTMVVMDWVEGKETQRDYLFTWYFLVNPAWNSVIEDGNLVLTRDGQTVFFEDVDKKGFALVQGLYCPSYQVKSPCRALKASCKAKAGEKIRSLLRYQ